LNT
ncbi:hypothetical protein CLOP_g3947, partial [Closterium sp. NIES-67]|jgi:hypothetical protein